MAAALFGLLYWMLQPSSSSSTSIAKVEKDSDAVEQADFQLIRFDRDVATLKSGEFNAQYASLKKKYGEWVDIYLFQILGLDSKMPADQLAVYVQGVLKEEESDVEEYELFNVDKGKFKIKVSDVLKQYETNNEFQKSVLDGLQLAYKVTCNSLYGQVGASTSPICFKELAASTTATGAKRVHTKPNDKTKGFLTFYNYNTKDPVKEEADPEAKERVKAQLALKHAKEKESLAAKHAQEKENLQTEELEEAKKKPVCPVCGKHECECGEQRPGISTDTTMSKDPFFKEDFTEKEIEEMINSVTDEDIEDLYEEDELVLVYDDDGEEIPPLQEESKYDLMEVLSRTERMKGKIRLRKTSAKRGRSTKIALKRYSNPETINKRARRLAIKLIKTRMLRGRDPAKVSIGEKERIEKTLSQRKNIISRVAQRLVSRVRKVEKSRMSHGKVTKGAMPSVF